MKSYAKKVREFLMVGRKKAATQCMQSALSQYTEELIEVLNKAPRDDKHMVLAAMKIVTRETARMLTAEEREMADMMITLFSTISIAVPVKGEDDNG